ncbi:MAG TPA: hypothetical protein VGB52_12205 [Actinomycetota bacterium]
MDPILSDEELDALGEQPLEDRAARLEAVELELRAALDDAAPA